MTDTLRAWVRPTLALGMFGLVVYLYVVSGTAPAELLTLFGSVVGFYFGERSALKGVSNGASKQA